MFKNQQINKTAFLTTVLLGLLLFFYSCSKSPNCWGIDKNKGIISESIEIDCSPTNFYENYTITTDSAYLQTFTDSLSGQVSCNLPAIDFKSYSLLGLRASGQCELKITREATRLDSENKFHYKVIVKSCGLCKKEVFAANWVTVPKLPNGWTVTFEVKK